jgi:hypothetical protein
VGLWIHHSIAKRISNFILKLAGNITQIVSPVPFSRRFLRALRLSSLWQRLGPDRQTRSTYLGNKVREVVFLILSGPVRKYERAA